MMFTLRGKTAVITGAGSGIGQAIALLFGAQGARVIVLDISVDAGNAVADRIASAGGSSLALGCDVTSARSVQAAFDAMDERGERIDVLINNAGIAHVGNVENTDEASFDRVYGVNVKGVYLCTRAGIRRMLAGGRGVILNMASIASLIGVEDRFAYSMSKGAVLSMTRSIAVDYMGKGIRCNCICPARVHTPFVDRFVAESYPGSEAAMFEKLSKYQPIGRMGSAEEVAAMALYLCSDEASFITGQAFPIDGGVLVK
jgi:NAD(P)-dependent dehydrogenase (short-subunit alcohol dehydrogenase family)